MTTESTPCLHSTKTVNPPRIPIHQMAKQLEKVNLLLDLGNGAFSFQGLFLETREFLDSWMKTTALRMGAIEQAYPVLWPISLLKEIDYFHDFPQNPFLVTRVKATDKTRAGFAEKYARSQTYDQIKLSEELEPISFALGTSTCDPCYALLRNHTRVTAGTYTAKSKCFRNESEDQQGLARLREFSMREIIRLGTSAETQSTRSGWLEQQIQILEFLDLNAGIYVSNDPFFGAGIPERKQFQLQTQTKYEVRYQPNEQGEGLAIGSLNWHSDFFGRAFQIRDTESSFVNSACWAFGLERLVLAIFSQHGLEVSQWPSQLKSLLESHREALSHVSSVYPVTKEKTTEGHSIPLPSQVLQRAAVNSSLIKKRLHQILAKHFSSDAAFESFDKNTLSQWDSLSHLKLISRLEEEFDIQIPDERMLSLHHNSYQLLSYLLGEIP